MKGSWISLFSNRTAIWWVLGAILVSAGAGATTAAVTDPLGVSSAQAVYGTRLDGTATIISNQAIQMANPTFTGPGPAFAPLPSEWRAFARISDKKDGFQASMRVPYGSTLVMHMPLTNTANVDVPLKLKLDVPDGFDVDLDSSSDSAARYTNLVGDAGNNAFYINIPANASIELQLSIKVPVTTGAFNLQATFEPES